MFHYSKTIVITLLGLCSIGVADLVTSAEDVASPSGADHHRDLQDAVISNLVLYDAVTNQPMIVLTGNDIVVLSDFGASANGLNVVAETTTDTIPIQFTIVGTTITVNERNAPFALWYAADAKFVMSLYFVSLRSPMLLKLLTII